MRTVFNSASDVMHIFAQRTQNHARSSNVFFYGNQIYSYGYHYLLGEFLDDNTILINDKGYSNTTAKHINYLIQATSQYKRYYLTETNETILLGKFQTLLEKLAKAKKPEIYISEINYLFSKYSEFQAYKKQKLDKELIKLHKTANNGIDLEKYKKAIQAKEKREKAQKAKEAKKQIEFFRTYETNRIYKGLTGFDYLRISRDKQFVETSQNLQIEISEAKKLAFAIEKGINIVGYKIKYYTVKSIDKKQLIIGCHNFEISEINEMIKQFKNL